MEKQEEIARNLFEVCKQGVNTLTSEFSPLTENGKFEVLIFNSLLGLQDINNNYSSIYDKIAWYFFALLTNEAKRINIKLDDDSLSEFINGRYRFFNEELQRLYSPQPAFPGGTYHVFYENPLTLEPKISGNLLEIMLYYKALTSMMNFIADNTNNLG